MNVEVPTILTLTVSISIMIYLYIKQHSITGLKYFGKTTRKDPFSYPGSGTRWWNHINKHGKEHIQTVELYGFDNQELCTEFALKFSEENSIVESDEWANLRPENGLDGITVGTKFSETHKRRLSESSAGRTHSEETKIKIATSNLGQKRSESTKKKLSLSASIKIGNKNPFYGKQHTKQSRLKMSKSALDREPMSEVTKLKISLKGCGQVNTEETKAKMSEAQLKRFQTKTQCPHCGKIGAHNMNRYHFDNCKVNSIFNK